MEWCSPKRNEEVVVVSVFRNVRYDRFLRDPSDIMGNPFAPLDEIASTLMQMSEVSMSLVQNKDMLATLPIDVLKLDMRFVQTAFSEEADNGTHMLGADARRIQAPEGVKVIGVDTVAQALSVLF